MAQNRSPSVPCLSFTASLCSFLCHYVVAPTTYADLYSDLCYSSTVCQEWRRMAKTKFYSNKSHRFIQLSQNDSTQKHSWAYCRGEYTSFGWLFVYAKYTIRENCVQSAVRWVVTGRGKVRSERKFSVPYSRGLLLTECNELFTRNFAVKAEKIWQTNYGFKKLCSINTASKLKSRGRS